MDIIRISFAQSSLFLGVAVLYALLRGNMGTVGIAAKGLPEAFAYGIGLFLAFAPLVSIPMFLGIRNRLEEVLSSKLTKPDVLWVSLMVSLGEEMFFRGLLVPVIGVIPSAVLFGAMHYVGYESLLEVGYALSMGLAIGYLYKYFVPNIVFPVVFHFCLDVFSLLLAKRYMAEEN